MVMQGIKLDMTLNVVCLIKYIVCLIAFKNFGMY